MLLNDDDIADAGFGPVSMHFNDFGAQNEHSVLGDASTQVLTKDYWPQQGMNKRGGVSNIYLYDINKDILASATSPHHLVVRVDCTAIYGLIKPVCKRVAASICYHIVRITITI